MTADRDPLHLYPDFRAKVARIVGMMESWAKVHWPGHGAMMSEGFRTTARQKELYAQGRTVKKDKDGNPLPIVTQKNGTTNPSNHQSALAADIVGKTANGQPTWECPAAFWAYLRHCAHVEGLTSGSDWHSFIDEPHVEAPGGDTTLYGKARQWKSQNGLA